MNLYGFPPLITGILIIIFALFVFSRNPKGRSNFSFFIMSLSLSTWLLCFSGMYLSTDSGQALAWARIGFFGVIFIPITAFQFFTTLTKLAARKKVLIFLYILAIPFALISQTKFIYAGVTKCFCGYYPVAGALYFIFLLMFVTLFSLGIYVLFRAYQEAQTKSDHLQAQQLKYVFFGFAFGITGAVDYLIKYKMIFYPFGYISALFFVLLIAYAILKHRLMDIKIVIRKTLLYSVLASIFTGLYLSILFFAANIFQSLLGIKIFLIAAVFLFAFAILFQPLKNKVQEIIDKLFFKSRYEYQNTLKNLSNVGV